MPASIPERLRAARTGLCFAVLTMSAGCQSGQLGPEPLCVAVVNVNGVFFGASSEPRPSSNEVTSHPYLTVTRNTGCLDQGEPSDPLADGESNFLNAGVTLHTVDGHDPSKRLAYWSPTVSEWMVLMPRTVP